jgi:hypothetical protein
MNRHSRITMISAAGSGSASVGRAPDAAMSRAADEQQETEGDHVATGTRGAHHCPFTAADAARCTARHGVGSHAEPPTMECAIPTA